SKKHIPLIKKVQAINNRQLIIVKSKTLFAFIIPAGISRMAVLGFFASKFLSKYRLNDMAGLRAKTMQRTTSINFTSKLFSIRPLCNQIDLSRYFKGYASLPVN